eukprot:52507-Chlamydomonas_euryale.AAC.1
MLAARMACAESSAVLGVMVRAPHVSSPLTTTQATRLGRQQELLSSAVHATPVAGALAMEASAGSASALLAQACGTARQAAANTLEVPVTAALEHTLQQYTCIEAFSAAAKPSTPLLTGMCSATLSLEKATAESAIEEMTAARIMVVEDKIAEVAVEEMN